MLWLIPVFLLIETIGVICIHIPRPRTTSKKSIICVVLFATFSVITFCVLHLLFYTANTFEKILWIIYLLFNVALSLTFFFISIHRSNNEWNNPEQQPYRNQEAIDLIRNINNAQGTSTVQNNHISNEPCPPSEFLNHWAHYVHYSDEQEKRFRKATYILESRLHNVDHIAGIGYCTSSSKREEYSINYYRCSCPDFQWRNLPCKHMYALALKTGGISGNFDFSGVSADVQNKIKCIESKDRHELHKLITQRKPTQRFIVRKNPSIINLIDVGLLTEHEGSEIIIDKNYTKQELLNLIKCNNLKSKPKSSMLKMEIIRHIIQNEPKFAYKLYKGFYYVSFSPEITNNLENIKRLLMKY